MWAFIASLIAFGIVGWVFALRYRIALDRRLGQLAAYQGKIDELERLYWFQRDELVRVQEEMSSLRSRSSAKEEKERK